MMINNSRILHLLFFGLLNLSVAYGQDSFLPEYNPPSPEASSLGKYGEHEVSLFTGTPSINIPLHTIQTGRINVPISLSYHASGVKVSDIASRIGLGWSLNAGGVITRTVRGQRDELDDSFDVVDYYGLFNLDKAHNYSLTNPYPIDDEVIDTEPDTYFYNFGGRSGKFVFNRNKNIYLSKKENIHFKQDPYNGSADIFVLITEDGIQYTFSDVERTKPGSNCNPVSIDDTYTSAWYLSEIHDPMTGETVTFHYGSISSVSYSMTKSYTFTPSNSYACFDSGINNSCTNNSTVYNAKYLDYISYDKGKIEFNINSNRQDLVGDVTYSSIDVKNSNNELEKGYTFSHSYATAGCGTSPECKRLILDSVTERGASGGTLPPYEFYYKSLGSLPSRNSPQQDIWGYYNANGAISFQAPTVYVYPQDDKAKYLPIQRGQESPSFTRSGQDRSANINTVDYGVLEKIVYPTGGHTIYEYEPNYFTYNDGYYAYTGGGIRIKRIVDHTPGSVAKTTEYGYSDGFLGGALPQVAYPVDMTGNYGTNLMSFSQNKSILGANQGGIVGYKHVTEKVVNGTTSNGYTKYTYLDEVDPLPSQDETSDYYLKIDQECSGNSLLSHLLTTSFYPFFEMESREHRRGVLDNILYFDANNNIVRLIDYDYKTISHESFKIAAGQRPKNMGNQTLHSIRGVREFKSQNMLLTSEIVTDYFGSESKSKSTTYSYYDDYTQGGGPHNLALHTRTEHGGNEDIVTEYYYPFNFASTTSGGAMGLMADPTDPNYLHYVSPVVYQETTRVSSQGTELISGKVSDYSIYGIGSGQYVLPKDIYAAKITTPISTWIALSDPSSPGSLFEKRVEFLEYGNRRPELIKYDNKFQRMDWDLKGNLKSIEVLTGISQYTFLRPPQGWSEIINNSAKTKDFYYTYLAPSSFPNTATNQGEYYVSFWAKDGNYVFAGSNAGYLTDTAPSTWTRYFHKVGGSGWDGPLSMSGSAKISSLRIYGGLAQITTYHYDKHNRLISISDPSNTVTSFEYDEFGRLINQKDTNDDIEIANYYNFK
ncbi:RHS repeat domain-containing protein [Ekhidna sp.]|uniref:RHS repeat protein n=1 Tax=Ekhidna sp. TaxID=2608089 RepID=UPI003296DA7A